MKESQLVKEAVQELLVRGIPAWRNNTGFMITRNALGQRTGVLRMGQKGAADIIGCLPPYGQLLAAEAKGPKGKVSSDQERFLKAIRKAGGRAFVFRSVKELIKEIER
jgi:hypothetical protein